MTTTSRSYDLAKVREDIDDSHEALVTYWSRSASDMDCKVADLHIAIGALMRALSTLTLAVEREMHD